jgi:hypothetical protein
MRDFLKSFLFCLAFMLIVTITALPICLIAEKGYPDWLMYFYYIIIPFDTGILGWWAKSSY